MDWSAFLQYVIDGLTIGAFLSLVALGYTMVYGIIRLINFAHGDIVMAGAFIGYTVLTTVTVRHTGLLLLVIVALVVTMAVTASVGGVIERVAYAPLLKGPPLAILISALGASLALEETARIVFGAGFTSYPHLLSTDTFSLGGARISWVQISMFVLCGVLMLGLYTFVHRTATGTALRALAMDRDAARLMGVNVERLILLTFLLGSSLAGAAGLMEGLYYGQINFIMGFLIGLRAFTAAVVGGIGNIPGAMVSGLLIGLLQSFTAGYVSSKWTDAVVFITLVLVLAVKPTGLFGERVAERV